jgi:AraC family transcriptional activator FtrA
VKIMPKPATHRPPRNLLVAALAYDGLCTFEFGIAVEIFGLPRPEFDRWYRFVVCTTERGRLRAVGGVRVSVEGGADVLRRAGTIVVPGWRDAKDTPPRAMLEALRAAHARGVRIVSICSGIFVLAAAGLLEGRRCTTHWRYVEALRRRHPELRLEPDVLYVDDGDILTSAGGGAGIDLCLHIVRRDWGPRIANQVARRLIIPPHREGGQAQFVERPVAREGSRFAALFDWARKRLDEELPIDRLAAEAGMSRRNFMRRFREATGSSPGEWLVGERVARARELLEAGRMPVERVATACGFGSTDTLRHHFRRRLRTSPQRYRAQFGAP